MATWRRGRELLARSLAQDGVEPLAFFEALSAEALPRSTRTAVYAVTNPDIVPQALLHNLKHNQVLHERNLILTVVFHDTPWVAGSDRIRIRPLAPGFWKATVNYGFKDTPSIPDALALLQAEGLAIDPYETTYFLSRETIVSESPTGMARWRWKLFAFMARNAGSMADFFRLPSNGVIELGTRVQV